MVAQYLTRLCWEFKWTPRDVDDLTVTEFMAFIAAIDDIEKQRGK